MKNSKRILSGSLAALQIAWSFSAGAYQAVAQVVQVAPVRVSASAAAVVPVSLNVGAASLGSAQSLTALSLAPALTPSFNPAASLSAAALSRPAAAVSAAAALAAPSVRAAAPAAAAAPSLSPAEAPAPAPASVAAGLSVAARSNSEAFSRAASRDVPTEGSSLAGAEAFAQVYGEKLIEGRAASAAVPVAAAPSSVSALRLHAAAFAPAPDERRAVEAAVPSASVPAAPKIWQKPAVRAALGLAAAGAVVAALPLLAGHVAAVAAAGSIALSVIGIPQIVRNAKAGKEAVKDLAIGSSLIWFAAATLLSAVSIGQGSSLWWNAANVAGVAESAAVVGQINWHKRDAKEIKATAATAAAVLVPMSLMAARVLLPMSAWLTASFTAAMGLLWVLNWPQIRQNYKLYKAEGRAPKGISPLYPALVAGGSLLHLYAAIMGGDVRWMMNASIAIATAALVLAQIYFPRAANAVLGPLVRLSDRLIPGGTAPAGKAGLQAQARALVAARLPAPEALARFAGPNGGADLARAMERARALPGRSVVFLEAPTAAGKSTLAKGLETNLGSRIKVFPVDRYFKAKGQVPTGPDGQPDFDRPESLDLDRVARDIRTLLAGGRVELPLHDMAAETTRYDSGEFLSVGADEVLVVDSIYASHDKLVGAAEGHATLNLFLDAPAVVRLARRLRRDRIERNIPAENNLSRWPVILGDERDFIQPLKRRADFVLNLVGEAELAALADSYGEVLAAEWAEHGQDPAMTERFLQRIEESLAADAPGLASVRR